MGHDTLEKLDYNRIETLYKQFKQQFSNYLVNGKTNNFPKETTMMRKAFGLIAVLALLAASAFAQEAPKPPAPPPIKTHLKVGDKAPDFKLTGVDGKVVELKKLKGKSNVVLAFYPKAFTGG